MLRKKGCGLSFVELEGGALGGSYHAISFGVGTVTYALLTCLWFSLSLSPFLQFHRNFIPKAQPQHLHHPLPLPLPLSLRPSLSYIKTKTALLLHTDPIHQKHSFSCFPNCPLMASSKWFPNTSLRLSLGGSKSKPRSRSSNSSTSTCMSSSSTPKTITREDELIEVFRRFDGNGDGKISAHELRSYFGSIGEYMSHEEAEGVIHDLDSDGDNLVDLEDFKKLMKKEGGGGEDLKKAFEMFEWEKGSGCITPKGLQRMLHRLGDDKSHDECVAMIHAFDVDRNGVLDFNEFLQMMA